MQMRKEMKVNARQLLKKHYSIYLVICLVAVFFGTQFTISALNLTNSGEMNETPANITNTVNSKGLYDVLYETLLGNEDKGKEISKELLGTIKEQKKDGILARSEGVLANMINAVTSGSIFVPIIAAANSLFGSTNITVAVFIVISLILSLCIWALLTNVYPVIMNRMFLEGRCYEKLHLQRFLFLINVRKYLKASWVMFVKYSYQLFWVLTIVGGVIKHFSYYLVPYIVAENPEISARKAISLSRKMMYGYKWNCFLFECSFLGWELLSVITFGLSGVLYSNAYKTAAFCEFYAELRKNALEKGIEGSEFLGDTYLFERAEEILLQETYHDVLEVMAVKRPNPLTGLKGFLSEYLGITYFYSEEDKAYEDDEKRQTQIRKLKYAATGEVYPTRLSPIRNNNKLPRLEELHYMRRYSICSIIMLFFIVCFIGWFWEVAQYLLIDGVFVKRGVLNGPWLPIYGCGGILILMILKKLRDRPFAEFFGIIILCGTIEYFTAFFLEKLYDGTRWWNYSGYFLNLHGRICAEGLFAFGMGGMLIAYILGPILDNQIKRIPKKILIILCAVLLSSFILDVITSAGSPNTGSGITTQASLLK